MKIKVLGCSGAEFPGHNQPGFLLGQEILFDAGSVTNVLHEKEQLKIKNIFITHAHLDHVRCIPFLADNILTSGKKGNFTVRAISPTIETIRRDLMNGFLWPDFTIIPSRSNAVVTLVTVKADSAITIGDYRITPYKVNHSVPAVGYLVEDGTGKRFFYTGDTGPTDETWKKIGNSRIQCLIIEVSLPNKMAEMALATGHLTSRLLKEELPKLGQMPERVYITHLKPQFLKTISREIESLNMKNLRVLKDGETIRI